MIQKKYEPLTIIGAGLLEVLGGGLSCAVLFLSTNMANGRLNMTPFPLTPICAAFAGAIGAMALWAMCVVIPGQVTLKRGIIAGLLNVVFTVPRTMVFIMVARSSAYGTPA